MDKTSFPLHGFILFLHRIKLGHRNSDKRPNEFLRPAGTLANRIFHIATVIGTFDNHLPNQHYRNQQQQYCTKQGGHFPEQGGFQHSLLLCNGSRIRRLCGKNLKLCEVTVKSKRGQHATFLHVAQRDFAVKQTGDLTDKRQPQTAAFLPICTRQRVKAFKNT